jgi:hypothetical protein
MSSRSSFSYSKPSLDVSFSVDGLNLDPDYVFGPDQDLFSEVKTPVHPSLHIFPLLFKAPESTFLRTVRRLIL